jgi:hypothetical protein
MDEDELANFMSHPLTCIYSIPAHIDVVMAHDLFKFRNPDDAALIAAAPDLLRQRDQLMKLAKEAVERVECRDLRDPDGGTAEWAIRDLRQLINEIELSK